MVSDLLFMTFQRVLLTNTAVWGTGDRVSSNRDGSLSGARVYVESRGTIDWALTLNTREYGSENEFDELRWYTLPDFLSNFPIAG